MLNFVYINTHDTGRTIEPYGYAINTPHLLDFAKDSTMFNNAFCVSPTCSPSRSSMLTSTMPHQNGMLGLAQRGFTLANPKHHLANYLKSNGYETAISGIQHEVGWYFDIDNDLLHNIGYQHILTTESESYEKTEYHNWDSQNAKAAIKWLNERDSSKPFMLSYGLHSTHRPYPVNVDKKIDERYIRPVSTINDNSENRHDHAQYMTSAQYADDNINMVLQALKDLGIYDNTVILFTTDHGLALPFHKCTLKDNGIAVSLMLRHPEKGHGAVVDKLVSHLDVFPTLCDCLGLPIPDYVEGKSGFEMLSNQDKTIRDEIFAQVNFHTSYEPSRCVRTERYKYIKYFDDSWKHYNISNMDEAIPKEILLEHGLKDKAKPMEALYDCLYDPNEMNNLVEDPSMKEVLEDLRHRLQQQMIQSNDPLVDGEIPIKPTYKVNKKSMISASSKNKDDYDPRGFTDF